MLVSMQSSTCLATQRASARCFKASAPAPRVVSVVAQATGKRAPAEAPVPALTRPKPASAEKQAQAQAPSQGPSQAAIAEAYAKAAAAKERGETVEVKVVGQNEGGVMVQFGPLRGFMPYNKVDPARLRACADGDLTKLVGQQIKARIITADISRKELVLSERQVAAAEALGRVVVGDVIEGVVTGVEDYGAFIQVKGLADVFGLVHKSEVTWARILTVDEVLKLGQEVRAKVLSVDVANCRLALSIKQLTTDPLKVSLDGLDWEAADVSAVEEPELKVLVESLAKSPGVSNVDVTRVAVDPHHVAQELEVYLVRTGADGVYDAVARLGTSSAQLKLTAPDLSRDQVKQMLQRVAREVAAA
ncbi:hypothetical protein HYH02_000674 [Chlamydomonas schloesseri]|uniref:S1 motif domain-containing protein n=1 Tax=Chlamydomonas schloesseri TaxID=2026947 RepID=A0A835WVL4_9CHLO|nr:hypothetical protein HYH02_000674 [Chlamydomonas schloesseri]|eukprot:KAG2454842.1 hypothetical protein HYH02_000674 [Chlamydomonas schloesseri]